MDWEFMNREKTIAMAFKPRGFGHAPLPPSSWEAALFAETLCQHLEQSIQAPQVISMSGKQTLFSDRLHVTNRSLRGSDTPKTVFRCLRDETAKIGEFVNKRTVQRAFTVGFSVVDSRIIEFQTTTLPLLV